MNDVAGGRRPNRDAGESSSAAASSQPVPVVENQTSKEPDSDLTGDAAQAMSVRSELGRSDIGKRSTSNQSLNAKGSEAMSLSPTVGAPSIELGRDVWAAPLLDRHC